MLNQPPANSTTAHLAPHLQNAWVDKASELECHSGAGGAIHIDQQVTPCATLRGTA